MIERGGGLRDDAQLIEDFNLESPPIIFEMHSGAGIIRPYIDRKFGSIDRVPEIENGWSIEKPGKNCRGKIPSGAASYFYSNYDIFGPVPFVTSR